MTETSPPGFGWVITSDLARTRYVLVGGNGDWSWVREARRASVFPSKARAEHFIFRNMAGAPRAVEHNW